MRLNSKGNAPWCLAAAIVALGICYLTTVLRSNEYADIPAMKASKSFVSDEYDAVKIKAGEEFRILGADWKRSERDVMDTTMLLVQNVRGERTYFNPDILSEEQMAEIKPALKHKAFANKPAFFNRKTMTRAAVDSIPLGLSIEQIDSIFVPIDKIVTEDGVLKARYLRMDVFDKETGQFYIPYMLFKDGKYSGCELTETRKKHMNLWLMKILPGASWVYDHNVFNLMAQKKAFGKLWESPMEIEGFFGKLMGLAVVLLIAIVIFAFYAFVPAIPAYLFYGILLFPPIFKLFNRTVTSVIVLLLAIPCYYYCWVAFMPYLPFFVMPCILLPAAFVAIGVLLSDTICAKCRYMETIVFDHRDLLQEYDIEKDESSTQKIDSQVTARRKKWDDVTHTTRNAATGQVLNSYTTQENVRHETDYLDTYRTRYYHNKYHIKEFQNYYRCEVCGNITTDFSNERKLVSSELTGSKISTSSRTEQN